ncbi:MAG: diguanylate cyclase [Acidothermus sp.]|nr:diguanylate cyclase [Acidothermus sp.]
MVRGTSDRAVAATWGAILLAVGGSAALSVTILPYWPVSHPRAYMGIGIVLLVCAGVLAALRRRTGPATRHGLLTGGIVCVSLAVWAAGPGPQSVLSALFYSFPALYAAAFTRRRTAASYLAVIAAAYLAVLGIEWRAAMATQWAITMAVIGVPALVINRLIGQLSRQAWYDALTGLPNRRLADFLLPAAMASAQRHDRLLAIATCDLDELKTVNDTHGHHAGDQLLARVGRTWAAQLRTGDLLARTGGDEFLLILPETTPEAAVAIIERMRAATPDVSFTAGVAVWDHAEPEHRLLHRADAALYQAKMTCRGTTMVAPSDQGTPASRSLK